MYRSPVSPEAIESPATGTYCFLTVRVVNTGHAVRRFVATAQRLIDREERRLEIAQRETIVMNPGEIGDELNPGLAIEVMLVFDIADPRAITEAGPHDSVLSRGATILLDE